MADAIPVQSPEVATEPVKSVKKGAVKGIPADVLEAVNEQSVDTPVEAVRVIAQEPRPFKVDGGIELASHAAVREDF